MKGNEVDLNTLKHARAALVSLRGKAAVYRIKCEDISELYVSAYVQGVTDCIIALEEIMMTKKLGALYYESE